MSAYYRALIQCGPQVLTHFPLSSNLLDTISGASATFSRSTAKTAFTDSTPSLVSLGVNVPAFRSLGIHIEQADTNVLNYSGNVVNGWTFGSGTNAAYDVITDPLGTMTGDTLGFAGYRTHTISVVANTKFVYGIFVRRLDAEEGASIFIDKDGAIVEATLYFATGTATIIRRDAAWAADSDCVATQLADGWWHIAIRASVSSSGIAAVGFQTYLPNNAADDVLGWWGGYKTARFGSLIPTPLDTDVTRTADVLSISSAVIPYAADRTIFFRVVPNIYETGNLFTNGAFTVARNYTTNVWSLTIHQTGQVLNITGSPVDLLGAIGVVIVIQQDGKVTFDVQSFLGPVAVTSTLAITGALWDDITLGTTHNGIFSDLAYINKAVTLDEAIALI